MRVSHTLKRTRSPLLGPAGIVTGTNFMPSELMYGWSLVADANPAEKGASKASLFSPLPDGVASTFAGVVTDAESSRRDADDLYIHAAAITTTSTAAAPRAAFLRLPSGAKIALAFAPAEFPPENCPRAWALA